MFKSTLMTALSLILISPSVGLTQEAPVPAQAAPTPKLTGVISCAEMDGSLTHRLSKSNDGTYSAYITFPVHYKKLSEAELQESQKKWKEWDGNGPMPQDTRKIGVSLPLESGNIYNFDIPRLADKTAYFDSLFPPVANSAYIPVGFGSFAITFAENECSVIEAEGHMKVFCQNYDTVIINNIEITQRVLEMSSEITSEVILDQETQKNIVIKTPKVKTSLILKSKTDEHRTQNFRSSYTYTPDGNAKQCHIHGKKLTSN